MNLYIDKLMRRRLHQYNAYIYVTCSHTCIVLSLGSFAFAVHNSLIFIIMEIRLKSFQNENHPYIFHTTIYTEVVNEVRLI